MSGMSIEITNATVNEDKDLVLTGKLDMDGPDGAAAPIDFSFSIPNRTVKRVYRETVRNTISPAITKALLKLA